MAAELPPIAESEQTPLVAALLTIIHQQREAIFHFETTQQQLESEKQKLEAEQKRLEAEKKRLEAEKKRLKDELHRFKERLAQYEPGVWFEGKRAVPEGEAAADSYSLDAEQKRREKRSRKKKSPGRRPTEVKFADVARTEDIYPDGFVASDCRFVRERVVWRLEDGKAVFVGYRIFAGPGGIEGRIPGVTPRCEYGIEILVVVAYLKYVIGISLDKTCAVLGFFCGLQLAKSQADALMRQLSNHWEAEFDTLCDLLIQAAVVNMDETGWKVGEQSCSLWLFASQLHRVFLFGCRKDAATLDQMLPPDLFKGIGVSDDAAVYSERFVQGQKCWAHLLRKMIKLVLLYPHEEKYQRMLEELLTLYREAKKVAADGRLSEATLKEQTSAFEVRLFALCWPHRKITPDMKPHEWDFYNLVEELSRLCLAEELFTFVWAEGVEPTNNVAERLIRDSVQDRKAGRTNKTARGAHQRSVIVSVLESLRANLEKFTLRNVVGEVTHWMKAGISLFQEQWQKLPKRDPNPIPNTG